MVKDTSFFLTIDKLSTLSPENFGKLKEKITMKCKPCT